MVEIYAYSLCINAWRSAEPGGNSQHLPLLSVSSSLVLYNDVRFTLPSQANAVADNIGIRITLRLCVKRRVLVVWRAEILQPIFDWHWFNRDALRHLRNMLIGLSFPKFFSQFSFLGFTSNSIHTSQKHAQLRMKKLFQIRCCCPYKW